MASYHGTEEWEERVHWRAETLHVRSRWCFPVLLLGALLGGIDLLMSCRQTEQAP